MTAYSPSGSVPPIDQPYPGAPFGAAFARFWKKGFTFSGRASRAEYWKAWLATGLLTVLLYVVGIVASSARATAWLGVIVLLATGLWAIAIVIPSIAAAVRRLHDSNQSGGLYFLTFIPFIGGLILLIFLAMESNPSGARFDLAGSSRREGLYLVPNAPETVAAPPPAPIDAAPAWAAPSPATAAAAAPPATPVLPPPAATPAAPVPPPPAPPAAATPGVLPVLPPPAPPAERAVATSLPASVPPPPAAAAGPITSIPGMPSRPVPPPPSASVPTAPAAPAASSLDETRMSTPAVAAHWQVALADGRSIPLADAVFFGRDPIADAEHPEALLVPIDDPAKSMSKTHARIVRAGDGVEVTDLHSTNGTTVTQAGGAPQSLTPGVAQLVSTTSTLAFGDYTVTVRRGA